MLVCVDSTMKLFPLVKYWIELLIRWYEKVNNPKTYIALFIIHNICKSDICIKRWMVWIGYKENSYDRIKSEKISHAQIQRPRIKAKIKDSNKKLKLNILLHLVHFSFMFSATIPSRLTLFNKAVTNTLVSLNHKKAISCYEKVSNRSLLWFNNYKTFSWILFIVENFILSFVCTQRIIMTLQFNLHNTYFFTFKP